MALKNSKNLKETSGFTIVELLIVIVVIAILATISIVAYSGIQQRAKTTKAQANASEVQKIAEAYNADNSVYPTAVSHFTSNNTAKLPSNITLLTAANATTIPAVPAALGNSNGDSSIMYRYVTGGTGACVFYWDFSGSGGISTNIIYMGNASLSNCTSGTGTTGNSLVTGS